MIADSQLVCGFPSQTLLLGAEFYSKTRTCNERQLARAEMQKCSTHIQWSPWVFGQMLLLYLFMI